MKMKKVLVFGTFDRLHKGHISFLRQAKIYGKLIVVVTRDLNVRKIKKRKPAQNEKKRIANVKKFADKVMLGEKKVTYKLIKKINPDLICIGYDQKPTIAQARKILKRLGMKNVKLKKMKPYKPKIYKSSLLNKLR